jgi:hypothetical protein
MRALAATTHDVDAEAPHRDEAPGVDRHSGERISADHARWISLRNDSEEAPSVGDALKLVLAGVFERQAAAGDEILHRLRDADL